MGIISDRFEPYAATKLELLLAYVLFFGAMFWVMIGFI